MADGLPRGYGFTTTELRNATFNAIQNPPSYAVFTGFATDFFPTNFTINPNEFNHPGHAAAAGGALSRYPVRRVC